MTMSRLKKILIALDQLLAVIFFAKANPDETFSAMCWRWELAGKRSWPRRLIDRIFWFDPNHCRESYESEKLGRQLPPEYRPEEKG